VASGKEAARVIKTCGGPDYQQQLQKELGAIRDSEMWRAGAAVRALRPTESSKAIAKGTQGVAGRAAN
jgi:ketol-acid reductoisomerase